MVDHWQKIDSRERADFHFFRVREDRSVSPRTGQAHDFFVLEMHQWVNVVALTPEGRVVGGRPETPPPPRNGGFNKRWDIREGRRAPAPPPQGGRGPPTPPPGGGGGFF